MCRAEATRLQARRDEFAPGTRLVAVVKEALGAAGPITPLSALPEVDGFTESIPWADAVVLDDTLAFYRALGGGALNRMSGLGFLAKYLLNPWSTVNANVKRDSEFEGNLVGEGLVTGGVYVFEPSGRVEFAFLESEIGDHAPIDSVVAATRAAASA